MRYDTCIKKHGKENNVWYIDIVGKDQNGRDVWLSGNVLDQKECGYGGFYNYEKVKKIFDNIETIMNIQPENLRSCSNNGVTSFKPRRVYIGYSPLDLSEDNIFYESRLINYDK